MNENRDKLNATNENKNDDKIIQRESWWDWELGGQNECKTK